MKFSTEEQLMRYGKAGSARALAMEILTNIGELYGATRFIELSSAVLTNPRSLSGTEAYLEFVRYFAGHKLHAVVPTYAEPIMDATRKLRISRIMPADGVKPAALRTMIEYRKQLRDLHTRLGFVQKRISPPDLSQSVHGNTVHMAIADPGIANFANSYLGIRTNSESTAVALCAALLGRTTYSGMHLLENRIPDIRVNVNTRLGEGDLALIGLYIGEREMGKIPYFKLQDGGCALTESSAFELGNALAYAGRIPMFHVADVTPEHGLYRSKAVKRKIRINDEDMAELRRSYRPDDVPELVVIGAPETALSDIHYLSKLIAQKGSGTSIPCLVYTSGETYKRAVADGSGRTLERSGVELVGNCWAGDQVLALDKNINIVTDSVRSAFVLREGAGVNTDIKLLPSRSCSDLAVTGRLDK